ncbi:hypothetical protein LEP1GSC058_3889 [Leptospira fainei serovar Hurstbridge str. BUT 6]|uniref:Uncharacterized protein n=1 Tax=Leptospira fainei serovar Hurstbridge str. BUT 6 TaxID=1193011 RepID=S3VZR2_9LEPT|nr:hypothetical protein LEP1GSC058_3889 [Leptospira fainei serovar Hurstbridge str. BUT 6]
MQMRINLKKCQENFTFNLPYREWQTYKDSALFAELYPSVSESLWSKGGVHLSFF